MAKFNKGDKVKMANGNIGVIESGPFPMGSQEMYHIRLADGRLTDSAERNLTAVNSRYVNSTRPIVQMALNRTACNGFDTLTIKKDGKFWRIYTEGGSDAARRVFDNPDAAKKYIDEKYGKGLFKLRVKNSFAPAGVVGNANSKEYDSAIAYLKGDVAKAAKAVVSSMDNLSRVASNFYNKAHDADEAGATNPVLSHAVSDLMEFEKASESLRRLAFRL